MVTTRSRTTKQQAAEDDQPRVDETVTSGNAKAKVVRKGSSGSASASSNGTGAGAVREKKRKERDVEKEDETVNENEKEEDDAKKNEKMDENEKEGTTKAEEEKGKEEELKEGKIADDKEEGKPQVDDSKADIKGANDESGESKQAGETDDSPEHKKRKLNNEDKKEADDKKVEEKEAVEKKEAAGHKEQKSNKDHDHDKFSAKGDTKEAGHDTAKIEREIVHHQDVREYGRIHFLFKPKVEVEHPKSIDDVQRMHIILQPHAKSKPEGKDVLSRLLIIGRKTLPGGDGGKKNHPFWAFISQVSKDVSDLHGRLEQITNETMTRGTRVTGADRFIASGPYCIISQAAPTKYGSNPDRRRTTLVYMITMPSEMGEVQKAFGIEKEGAFVISVKNPEQGGPLTAGLKEKATYPKELQSLLRELRWGPVDPPTYLDHENAELLFISSHNSSPSDIANATDPDIAHEMEEIVDQEQAHESGAGGKMDEKLEKEIFEMLKVQDDGHVLAGGEALISGKWE